MKEQSLGDELVSAIKEALESKLSRKRVRPHLDRGDAFKRFGMSPQKSVEPSRK